MNLPLGTFESTTGTFESTIFGLEAASKTMLANHLPFLKLTKKVINHGQKGSETPHYVHTTLAETLAQLCKPKSNTATQLPRDHQIHIAQTIRQHTCDAPEGGTNTAV